MKVLTIRNVSEETHRALRMRAAQRGHSLQTELSNILAQAVKAEGRVQLGNLLADIGRQVQLSDEEAAAFERSPSAARAATFD